MSKWQWSFQWVVVSSTVRAPAWLVLTCFVCCICGSIYVVTKDNYHCCRLYLRRWISVELTGAVNAKKIFVKNLRPSLDTPRYCRTHLQVHFHLLLRDYRGSFPAIFFCEVLNELWYKYTVLGCCIESGFCAFTSYRNQRRLVFSRWI